MGLFGRKQEKADEVQKKIYEFLNLANIQIAKLNAEVELINAKLRKKVYKKDEEPEKEAPNKIDDGFDELRNINKRSFPDY